MTGAFLGAIVQSFFEAVKAFCGLRETQVAQLSQTEVIDDKRDLEKACKYAELAISCAEKYKYGFSKLDRASFLRNVKRFRRLK